MKPRKISTTFAIKLGNYYLKDLDGYEKIEFTLRKNQALEFLTKELVFRVYDELSTKVGKENKLYVTEIMEG